MIRALVFDFDGLIVDTETPLIEAYGDVHAAHGRPFDRAEFLHTVGHVDFAFNPWRGFGPDAHEAALEAERHVHNRRRTLAQPVLPGVATLLDAARAAKRHLAIASNSSHEHVEGHLRRLGLHAHFAFFACRGDTPSPKPEPDLYKLS
jgi:HAD superfamily hydrolase (TIGR01509 family)